MTDGYKSIPKEVRVGCYVFRVEVAEAEDSEIERSFGHMNGISQKIRLRPGMTSQNLANTFIHEVLHAIYFFQSAARFSLADGATVNPHEIEEEFVTLGANGLCAFWQDNPKAMAWWVKINAIESVAR